jgi:hypothetical protein
VQRRNRIHQREVVLFAAGDSVKLIGHEIEHSIEQLDGVCLGETRVHIEEKGRRAQNSS